jgi:DNA-directed RNA polymerase specialized sigma24 family protein
MPFKISDREHMYRASEGSSWHEAQKQIMECENGELLWLAEAIVGDPRAAGCCVADATVRADRSAYVTPNWRGRWITRCVVREAVERNGAEIKRLAAKYSRDAICDRDLRSLGPLDKRALRTFTATQISKTLSIFERAALILHEYLGFSSHDCALLLECQWSVIDFACSNAAWRLFGEQTKAPEKVAGIGLSEAMA